MKKNYIFGLDIGTFKICLTCGTIDPSGRVHILASCIVPTQGVKIGKIIDNKKLSASIRQACGKLSKMCGVRVRRVYANIDSLDLRTKLCQGGGYPLASLPR